MAFAVKFTLESKKDIQEVYEWYEFKSLGLGDKFIEALDDKINKLSITPGIGSIRFDDVHCTILNKFPYFIYYSFDTYLQSIVIYRIFHVSRKPLWEK